MNMDKAMQNLKTELAKTTGVVRRCGFSDYREREGSIYIEHRGNMGNSIERSLDPNLKIMGVQSVAELKEKYPNHKEEGSCDYLYSLTLFT